MGIANGITWTVVIFGTSYNGDTPYRWVGIGNGTRWTGTLMRTIYILADGILSAGVWFRAFVYIVTLTVGITSVTRRTLAAVATWLI